MKKHKHPIRTKVHVLIPSKYWLEPDVKFDGVVRAHCNILLNGQATYTIELRDGTIKDCVEERFITVK